MPVALRMNHDRPGLANLLLQPGMAVVPVGAGLAHRKIDFEGLAGIDAGKGDAGHAVHLERQQNAVPVDRGRLVEMVVHPQVGVLSFPEFDDRAGRGVIERDSGCPAAGDIDRLAADMDVHHHIACGAARDLSGGGVEMPCRAFGHAVAGIGW